MVRNVIREEWELFPESDDDAEGNRSYSMEINLKDSKPVQLNCNAVLQNLYNELKMHIKDNKKINKK